MRSGRTCLLVLVALFACAPPAAAHDDEPLVIGHRGAPGYLPDHTLQGYALAAPDGRRLHRARPRGHQGRPSDRPPRAEHHRDHRRRDPEFASRETTKNVDGIDETGWFASDFTLAEIKTLRAMQPLATARRVSTASSRSRRSRRSSPSRSARGSGSTRRPSTRPTTSWLGLPLEGRLVRALDKAGWNKKRSPVFIQSFEQSNLKQLNRMTDVRLVQLVDAVTSLPTARSSTSRRGTGPYDWTVSGDPKLLARTFGFFATDKGLAEIATYADGIGPWKRYIVSTRVASNGALVTLPPTDLIQRAHRKGLLIHTWTFRDEPNNLAADYGGNPLREYRQFFKLGIDGVFSDFAFTAVLARERYFD